MSSPFLPPWFNHPNNIRRRIHVMKLIIMQFSSWSIFLPFLSCEHGNETSGSVKGGEFLRSVEWLLASQEELSSVGLVSWFYAYASRPQKLRKHLL
jgi:hypothetical protein